MRICYIQRPIFDLIVYAYAMNAEANSYSGKWSEFFATVWTQFRAAVVVGLPADVEPGAGSGCEGGVGKQPTRRAIRSLDDYAGYQTRNGLGSLDIGGGRSRFDE